MSAAAAAPHILSQLGERRSNSMRMTVRARSSASTSGSGEARGGSTCATSGSGEQEAVTEHAFRLRVRAGSLHPSNFIQ